MQGSGARTSPHDRDPRSPPACGRAGPALAHQNAGATGRAVQAEHDHEHARDAPIHTCDCTARRQGEPWRRARRRERKPATNHRRAQGGARRISSSSSVRPVRNRRSSGRAQDAGGRKLSSRRERERERRASPQKQTAETTVVSGRRLRTRGRGDVHRRQSPRQEQLLARSSTPCPNERTPSTVASIDARFRRTPDVISSALTVVWCSEM